MNAQNPDNPIEIYNEEEHLDHYAKRSILRKHFGSKSITGLEIPCMIKVQLDSYAAFLQKDIMPENRKNIGIQAIMLNNFPIINNTGNMQINFISYHINDCFYTPIECKHKGATYAGPIKLVLELIIKQGDEVSVQEKEIYIGEIPLMTDDALFVINGTERVIISQLHRSPGVFFEKIEDEFEVKYFGRIIPVQGLWLDFEADDKGYSSILINKKRIPLGQLLAALTDDEHPKSICEKIFDMICPAAKIPAVKIDGKIKILDQNHKEYEHLITVYDGEEHKTEGIGHYLFSDIVIDNIEILRSGSLLTEKVLNEIPENFTFYLLDKTHEHADCTLKAVQNIKVQDKTLINVKLASLIRPNEQLKGRAAYDIFQKSFFDETKYNLSDIGRAKLNYKFNVKHDTHALTQQDVIEAVKTLFRIFNGKEPVDHPDSLMHRRIRSVGELVGNQMQQAIAKMVKSMQDKMIFGSNNMTLSDLVNSRHFVAGMREFFGTSQLSQLADSTNLLSTLGHKRRFSAFGRGGVSGDRAFADIRGLDPTQYGRVCLNETPEGQSAGLVHQQTIYSSIDNHGFICTPYRKVINGRVTNEIVSLSCIQEINKVIAYYNPSIIVNNRIQGELIDARFNNEHYLTSPEEIDYIDVSPQQIVSLSCSLLPFMDNCDSVRAVMGANMQRQALPLIRPTASLIGTGMESLVVKDSGSCVLSKTNGTIAYVSGDVIIVQNDNIENNNINTTYSLTKFERSNDATIIDQIPTVEIGQKVKIGDTLAIGAGVQGDELALGRNLKIAFLSWKGYNYEDAVIVSSRVAKQFKSVSITRFEVSIREMRQGVEQWTRDIPNATSSATENLDECGIINIGTHVKADDILVGKITPKAETSSTPAERLIRAVFGSKGADVEDSSLRLPPRVKGTVIGVRVLSRKGAEKNKRIIEIEKGIIEQYIKKRDLELKILANSFRSLTKSMLADIKHPGLTEEFLNNMPIDDIIALGNKLNITKYKEAVLRYKEQREQIINEFEHVCAKELEGDSLPSGVLQTIHVFIATEYVLQVGDKIAGRHGNKGIISTVLNDSEMPFTKDGEPVDIILSCTGISSRMNVGQILETHLGWASKHLGKKINAFVSQIEQEKANINELRNLLLQIYDQKDEQERINAQSDNEIIEIAKRLKDGVPFACPVFEGPNKDRIKELLDLAGCNPYGKEEVFDPDTGMPFPQKVTVGTIYIMQLHHLIEKKEHARAVGPYSVITQQPLGGRAQKGGQRLGEMECWALQAHSAAYTTREMLTVKSDCPTGRARVFQLISQGYDIFNIKGVPESFAVLIHELRALCLNIECLKFKNGEFTAHEVNTIEDFDALRISVADPEQILSWSYGEVTKPETIHYRTFKPHPEGIFSTKIFGPIKDNQCLCGKHKGYRKQGIICSKCHTEVTSSKVRRHRMGHIKLVTPVVHVWFAKVPPSRISIVLDMSNANLNKILRLEYYAVISPGLSPKIAGTVISEQEYISLMNQYESAGFTALTGAEAIEALLKNIKIPEEIEIIKTQLSATQNISIRDRLLKRLQILCSFQRNNAKLESMVIRILGMIPPDLRPLVAIDGGRFASSDLNDLYRRVINRNNRLARMLTYPTPEIIIKNEKRMLQEAVDALLDNSRRNQPVTTANKRPLKSIADNIKGKQGRFRQNLLGKRVDYSGRSVIVVGPYLKFNQCGLPKGIALELLRPFVLARLILRGFVSNPRAAKLMIEKKRDEVWDILHEITKDHVVLLNRAPTLHRLGIQAFEAILVEGKAIHLNPLACKAFNADFDGDQVAVHINLSTESQLEARMLMMSTKCIINPANGFAIATPARDMILGLYAMTSIEKGFAGDNMRFSSFAESEHALGLNLIRYSTPIKVLFDNQMVETTYGRLELYQCIPENSGISFAEMNKPITSKDVQNIVYEVFANIGEDATVKLLDNLMRLGFEYATKCGATFSYSDLPVPEDKVELVAATKKTIVEYHRQYKEGFILREDLYNKTVSAWSNCADELAKRLIASISKTKDGEIMNPVSMMMVSGARGSENQVRQLSAMKGLVTKANGSVHESPVISSFIEGVNVKEYMISSQGARKSLTDIAFKTADSGYLTRRLVAVAQDVITKTHDCGTDDFIQIQIEEANLAPLHERVFGRAASEDILNDQGEIIVKTGEIINKAMCAKIKDTSITKIKIRSPITCKAKGSQICCKCYGYDLSTLSEVLENTAVGIIAAQSIGEPGTQLTMKNFQGGGSAQNLMSSSKVLAIADGVLHFNNMKIATFDEKEVVVTKNNIITLVNTRGEVVSEHRVPQGANVYVKDGDIVKKGTMITDWDNYISVMVAECGGTVEFKDITIGVSCREAIDKITGITTFIITKDMEGYEPMLLLRGNNGEIVEYSLQIEDMITVSHNDIVEPGQVLVERIKNVAKSQDIIGGLEHIVNLFEARKTKNPCIISPIDGFIDIKNIGGAKKVIIKGNNIKKEYPVHKNIALIVNKGDFVQTGDMLTDGKPCMHDILKINGVMPLARWIVNEVQSVYKIQGITIADKHIEIMVRQMLRAAKITKSGDTNYIKGEVTDMSEIEMINDALTDNNQELVQYEPILSGITRAAITNKESFISAASFQETPKILISAALRCEIDVMEGLKATMMTGQLMPIGVGGLIRDIHKEDRAEMLKLVKNMKIEHILRKDNTMPEIGHAQEHNA